MEIYEIINLAIKLVGAVIVLLVSKTCLPWLKEQRVYSTIRKLVQAAEKLAASGAIRKVDKKAYVLRLLEEKGVTITPEIEAMIESAVEELDWMAVEIFTGILEGDGDAETED